MSPQDSSGEPEHAPNNECRHTWNHRVVKRTFPTDDYPESFKDAEPYDTFGIHEVYYDGDGKITSWSVAPVRVYVEDNPAELLDELKLYEAAIAKPVLNWSELPR